jgi:hypothetical protein
VLQKAVYKAKLGQNEKNEAIKRLTNIVQVAEKDFIPNTNFDKVIEQERAESWKYGGRTVKGWAKSPKEQQLKLF